MQVIRKPEPEHGAYENQLIAVATDPSKSTKCHAANTVAGLAYIVVQASLSQEPVLFATIQLCCMAMQLLSLLLPLRWWLHACLMQHTDSHVDCFRLFR